MKKHAESHLDHGLSQPQIDHIFKLFADREEFFTATIELPPELGTAPCALWGPAMGDPEIGSPALWGGLPAGEYILPANLIGFRMNLGWEIKPHFDGAITRGKRGARSWESRLINAPMRPSRKVFVVAGPHEEHACILYTAYAGPEAPPEPGSLTPEHPKYAASVEFWKVHALSRYSS